MNFSEAVQSCFKKYANFSGRASRSECWWFILAEIILLIVASLINQYLYAIVVIIFLLPVLAVQVRRMHDIGKSGWFLLVSLIPLVGLLVIYFLVQPSQTSSNEYGSPPQ